MIGNGRIGAQTVAAAQALPASSGVIGGDPVSGSNGSGSGSSSANSGSSTSNKSGAATLAASSVFALGLGFLAVLAAC